MAVLALAVVSRAGGVVVARTYGAARRERVEALLRQLPRLCAGGSPRTPSCAEVPGEARIVHASLDVPGTSYAVALVTTLGSNVVQDVATVALAARAAADVATGSLVHAALPRTSGPGAGTAAALAAHAAAAAVGASGAPSGRQVWAAAKSASQGALSAVAGSPLVTALSGAGADAAGNITSGAGDAVREKALDIILAWDAILDSRGRRTDTNAAGLAAALAMDSRDEVAAEAALRRKESDAAEAARRKKRQIDAERREAASRAARAGPLVQPGDSLSTATTYGNGASFGESAAPLFGQAESSIAPPEAVLPAASVSAARGMKLGRRPGHR